MEQLNIFGEIAEHGWPNKGDEFLIEDDVKIEVLCFKRTWSSTQSKELIICTEKKSHYGKAYTLEEFSDKLANAQIRRA
ncbi:hypothetical protein [Pontibacillus salipaludis]|uniref:Uncharacterized protein n=1 Tax=Pontibacillus salipaludis TaxID=1697394 RepID=A0ABQ1PI67_9BACI|nr:hypothetical protein [Pontibacillus salipaludis]GGC97722.1 hypothetical protein GCM10011389_01080 [Pontibacillus salipaludis]